MIAYPAHPTFEELQSILDRLAPRLRERVIFTVKMSIARGGVADPLEPEWFVDIETYSPSVPGSGLETVRVRPTLKYPDGWDVVIFRES